MAGTSPTVRVTRALPRFRMERDLGQGQAVSDTELLHVSARPCLGADPRGLKAVFKPKLCEQPTRPSREGQQTVE
jgi:hypothetical protein